MAGVNDVVGVQSRHSGFGKFGCEASAVFRLIRLHCFSKAFKKIRTTMSRTKWSDNISNNQLLHGDIDERTRLCRVRRMHAPNFEMGATLALVHHTQ